MISRQAIIEKIKKIKNYSMIQVGDFMDKYRFNEIFSKGNIEVERQFLIEERVEMLCDFLKACEGSGFVSFRKEVRPIKYAESEFNEDCNNVEDYFLLTCSLDNEEYEEYSSKIVQLLNKKHSNKFAMDLVENKKKIALQSFNLPSAILFNDNIKKLVEDSKQIDFLLKEIFTEIRGLENSFVMNFNKFVADIDSGEVGTKKSFNDLCLKYTPLVIREYKLRLFTQKTLNMLDIFNEEEKKLILDNKSIKRFLGDDYNDFMDRVFYVAGDI